MKQYIYKGEYEYEQYAKWGKMCVWEGTLL